MANVKVYDMTGKETGTLELNDKIFGVEVNVSLLHEAVKNYLANQRQGTQSTKTRTEVRGGGRKPFRQKGTGRARQGSIRAPQWYHGGVALGPKPREYGFTLNKKERRLAIQSALSDKVLNNNLIVLDTLKCDEYKTKTVVECLAAIGAAKKSLIILAENDSKAIRSASNIKGVKTAQVNTINTYDILNADTVIVVKDAVAKIEEVYA